MTSRCGECRLSLLGDEYPILLHTDTRSSSTQADGIDTAKTNVAKGPNGWEVILTKGEYVAKAHAELATIVARENSVDHLRLYPRLGRVVFGGAKGDVTTRWVMNRCFVSGPQLDAAKGQVTFAGRSGTIHFLHGQPKLTDEPSPEEPATVFELVTPPPVQVFAFSNGSFRFAGHDAANEELTFRDESGRYRLALPQSSTLTEISIATPRCV